MTARYGMLMTTTPSHEDAVRIARLLIDEKLAACVQLLPIQSFYHWKEKTQEDAETLLLIKTTRALFEPAIARIKDVHEIVGTDIVVGFSGYLDWIDQVTG
jgi:periplasmic divalent cation tolerance protein